MLLAYFTVQINATVNSVSWTAKRSVPSNTIKFLVAKPEISDRKGRENSRTLVMMIIVNKFMGIRHSMYYMSFSTILFIVKYCS